jgi:DNA-binding NtrC family response regulator
MARRVLVVEDDPNQQALIEHELAEAGIECACVGSGRDALRAAREAPPGAVVLDLGLPDERGEDVLTALRKKCPEAPVVVLTARNAIDVAVECMRLGAIDFVPKPFEATRLITSVKNALAQGALRQRVESLAQELRQGEGFGAILGESPALQRAVALLARAAKSDVTVLLEGESGSGKEVAARAVHAESRRRTGPFVAVNCGAIPETLIESELFGHEKGAFTGAVQQRRGRFEQAEGGTIFLDEIGELRPDLQVRLLRVLQDRSFQRVGGQAAVEADVRVVAATNRDLKAEAARGAFREDLYYRLAVFPVRMPPLRERGEDVILLADAFLARFAERHGALARRLSAEARRALAAYAWPGNVRELQNVLERAAILEDGAEITLASLPDEVARPRPAGPAAAAATAPRAAAPEGGLATFKEEERAIILRALEHTGWNVTRAAQQLGLSRATLHRRIKVFAIERGPGLG